MAVFICLTSEFKGCDFIRQLHNQGHKVYLITSSSERGKKWPREAIEDIYYLTKNDSNTWDMSELKKGLNWFSQSNKIDRIAALDDFEVEKAATIREHFRISGMGQTTARKFRDKLAMRIEAQSADIKAPSFCALFHNEEISRYVSTTTGPWVIKPRSAASASGIKKVENQTEVWEHLHQLGALRADYLIERFLPGTVYHVDGIVYNHQILFNCTSKYLDTPLNVAQGGGIFRSMTLEPNSEQATKLFAINAQLITSFGLKHGVFHSEFIRADQDGQFYFLETAARVGGAHLAEMVEASTGVNLWKQWAIIESNLITNKPYRLPPSSYQPAGIILSLCRYQKPDTSGFNDAEIVWRLDKEYHIGFIIRSDDSNKIHTLLDHYSARIQKHFHASLPNG